MFHFTVCKNRSDTGQLESRLCEEICYKLLLWGKPKVKVWGVSMNHGHFNLTRWNVGVSNQPF